MPTVTSSHLRIHHLWLALVSLLLASTAWGEVSLPERYAALKSGLSTTLPGTTINLASTEQGKLLSAEVSSILHTPFDTVSSALTRGENWCQFMPLHFNIKACTYQTLERGELLTLYSGRKSYQSPAESYAMAYRFETLQQDDSRLSLRLSATHGPANTRDYLIKLDVLRVEEGALIHIHSSYRPSMLSSMLTRSYLATLGRNKVGFSQVKEEGEQHLVQGIRGVIERNVMRYHLAINAFLSSQPLAEGSRHEAELAGWFKQNDSYPLQLHEMSEKEYLQIKRRERENQQRLQQALNEKIHLAAMP